MQDALIAILCVWCGILTVGFFWIFLHNKKSRNRQAVHTDADLKQIVLTIQNELAAQNTKAQKYIQKVGFLKFNPFQETGGAQSFAVALLDRNENGFILTSLHSRTGTRTYAKLIERGKSQTELSSEEEKVLKLAQHEEIK